MKNNNPGIPQLSYCHKPFPKAGYEILQTYFKHLAFSVLLTTGVLLLPALCSVYGQSLPVITVDHLVLQVYPVDHAGEVPWGRELVTVGATSIVDGQGNTLGIVNEYGNWNQGNYAANVCAQLKAFGHSDWHLPSVNELAHIWRRRDDVGGFSPDAFYWTSTEEHGGNEAAALDFSSGIILERYKEELHRVRCVRRVSIISDVAASHNGKFIAVARYRINDRGEAGLVFASSLLGVFNAASFANSIAQFAGEVIKSEIKKSAIKYIISSASDDKPAPAYITILFPIRGENKPVEPEDIVFVQEYAGGNLLPLGYPISLTYRMVNENESSPVLVIANSYDLFPLDDGVYDYLPVDLASRGNHTTLASDKAFQTFGVVSKYKEYLGKTMLILKQYEHYNYGFASGTGLNFLAIKVSDHSQDVPAPGSVIKINGTTKNLREIGQGWRIRIEETPWYNVKSAKYVEAHTMQVVSGSRMPKADIVYDESIFSFYYDRNVYQAVVVDLSKASKQGIKGDNGVDEGTFTDPRDGQTYRWVRIGDQVWMAENLNYASVGSWCYNDNATNCDHYGRLYTWAAVMNGSPSSSANPSGVEGICPPGWHVPSDAEWTQLEQYICNVLGNSDCETRFHDDLAFLRGINEGNALKSCRQVYSRLGNNCDTSSHPRFNSHSKHYGFDEFGFSALPGGRRCSNGGFFTLGSSGLWWSSTEVSSTHAKQRSIYHDFGNVDRRYCNKAEGFSLRCLREP